MDPDVKTRVTQAAAITPKAEGADCIVAIYSPRGESGGGPALGARIALDGAQLMIGRGPENDIVLEGDSVSRRHARIEQRAGAWWITDVGSTNGTYVNHEAVRQHPLANGDLVKVGDTIFKYLTGSDVESKYHEEIYRMTIVDGLTQMYNKRYLSEVLEREVGRAVRYGRPLSAIMLDIDHFKEINDTFGHLAGDTVLKELAALVHARVRREEIVARYGGEEFAILLPETELPGAVDLAEQIRAKIAAHPFEFEGARIHVTVSGGVSMLDGAAKEDGVAFLKRADDNLYKAKRGGRNRVVS